MLLLRMSKQLLEKGVIRVSWCSSSTSHNEVCGEVSDEHREKYSNSTLELRTRTILVVQKVTSASFGRSMG